MTATTAVEGSITPPAYRHDPSAPLRPINWNRVSDEKDLEIWNRLTANFWLPEKVPLSNDHQAWQALAPHERTLTMRVFTGLTMLDTVQATVGEICQIQDARTEHEEAVYTNIAFMQSVHARSYSSVFSTLTSTREIDEAYRWAIGNDLLQARCKKVLQYYYGPDPLKRKVSSTLLSSLLLYAGFYLPLHFSVHATLTNTADMIRLILRDKAVHGYYSGYKYQRGLEAHPNRRDEMKEFTYTLLEELYDLELDYSGELYEPLGLMGDVAAFVRYNANKSLMNLGYPARFTAEETSVSPEILAALAPSADENHDFFSGSGSSYIIGKAEHTSDDDWDF
ncbi:class 1b ribonucleoside-diphosphate reductase subunit beta [Brachybacterium paraconglomeratum]|uniref:class 1b ribonucleoside-diphosphate reductase subunit beta n=1 Tax=Dermabacteraceae TaxID=85020 RepID=UPI000C803378|nr:MULTISPECIES: class 1b ribonucleoside-diphosphate reductase subunit beta [Dermabacteraceae]PZP15763.1 MAG: class 1b ribonucleoside-diphosphate reductase subunit beta [Brachybacterium faecium]MCT1909516.1 class 1b ribonucleoside-diphosphate reductase subunit beta [Brachybacterium paraconglomeratum]MDK7742998.1 class 1b ribonucleoside-diphosphate reductase subunit beta [Helcobacillus massiliensis]PMC74235.1 class 1b ribonucleoside-diphosphate reductase subunit beta [Brachybacterium sp. UMB0905